MTQASNAGPFRIGLDQTLTPGDTAYFNLPTIERDGKEGWYAKYFGGRSGLDWVRFANNTSQFVTVTINGGNETRVGPRSEKEIDKTEGASFEDAGVVRAIRIENPAGNSEDLTSDNFHVTVGNHARQDSTGDPVFDPATLIPGVTRR